MFLIALAFITMSCGNGEVDFYPKPMGFLRLDFPEREYIDYASDCNFGFEIPSYFSVVDKPGTLSMLESWFTIIVLRQMIFKKRLLKTKN
jgi:hypothetical protein